MIEVTVTDKDHKQSVSEHRVERICIPNMNRLTDRSTNWREVGHLFAPLVVSLELTNIYIFS